MILDMEFTLAILQAFEENPDAYMPVPLVAKKVEDVSYKVKEAEESLDSSGVEDELCLSNYFVFHMLHLQDLKAIVNMKEENAWGYEPGGLSSTGEFEKDIAQALESGSYVAPHCYMCEHPKSVIRLTAVGHQLREVLEDKDSSLTAKSKRAALYFGEKGLAAIIPKLVGSVVAAI